MTTTKNIAFWFLFTMILSISAIDLYLIIRFQNVMIYEEKNLVGVWLIKMDSGSVALFSALKMFGTCLSLMIWKCDDACHSHPSFVLPTRQDG